MRYSRTLASLAIAALALSSSANGASASTAPPPGGNGAAPACPGPAAAASARCHAQVLARVGRFATASPTGLTPTDIKSAYGWGSLASGAASTTIAIVDAYDDPQAENDLATFSATFGLPPCSTANGCFKKVNQTGGASYPRKDAGWALEISLDLQWAHAIAPGAKILLVEATTNSFANLLTAVDYAKTHAQYVSMSWGGSEFSTEASNDGHFVQSGVSFFASSGDSGTPASYPSASPNVISVGGTTLTNNSGAWGETGWSGSGGGCSAYETANAAQNTGSVSCAGKRATPDVSLDADPASGVSVYDSAGFQGQKGWFVVGGTSASAPMWAGRAAATGVLVNASTVYGNALTYRDITSGGNSAGCLVGYDLSTGRGSWLSATP